MTTVEPITLSEWKRLDKRKAALKALPERVWRLVNCEIAQSVQHIWLAKYPDDARPQTALDACRLWCRKPTKRNREKRNKATSAAATSAYAAYAASAASAATSAYAAYAASAASAATSAYAASAASAATSASATYASGSWKLSHAIYLSTLGDWQAEWNTSTVCGIAATIYESRDPLDRGLFLMLADALEESGCYDAAIFDRLRGDDSVLTRAELAVRMPLGIC